MMIDSFYLVILGTLQTLVLTLGFWLFKLTVDTSRKVSIIENMLDRMWSERFAGMDGRLLSVDKRVGFLEREVFYKKKDSP